MTEEQAQELLIAVWTIEGHISMMAEVLWLVLGMLSAFFGFFLAVMVLWWVVYRGNGLFSVGG